MTPVARTIPGLAFDEDGQTTIEWALLLAAVVLPVFAFLRYVVLEAFVTYYRMVTFMETLPFP